ncbi:hypothetical protein E4U46_007058 [Claviceps purpurea]|nr:hypothetical protein E4U46_007058 [Claviceps purpurea]
MDRHTGTQQQAVVDLSRASHPSRPGLLLRLVSGDHYSDTSNLVILYALPVVSSGSSSSGTTGSGDRGSVGEGTSDELLDFPELGAHPTSLSRRAEVHDAGDKSDFSSN